MPRLARIVIADIPFHITQRGNRRLDVFLDDEDRSAFLKLLRLYSEKYGIKIYAYCLMSNHYHLVAEPSDKTGLSGFMRELNGNYSRYFNLRRNFTGHLWQGRYFSAPLDDSYFWYSARYVEQNPVRAGAVAEACDYPWSSAKGNSGLEENEILCKQSPILKDAGNWRFVLRENLGDDIVKAIKGLSKTGRPMGGRKFIHVLEKRTRQRIALGVSGRPHRISMIKKKKQC